MGASLVSCFWSGGTYWWYLSFFTLGLGSLPFLLRLFSEGVFCWLCCLRRSTHSYPRTLPTALITLLEGNKSSYFHQSWAWFGRYSGDDRSDSWLKDRLIICTDQCCCLGSSWKDLNQTKQAKQYLSKSCYTYTVATVSQHWWQSKIYNLQLIYSVAQVKQLSFLYTCSNFLVWQFKKMCIKNLWPVVIAVSDLQYAVR